MCKELTTSSIQWPVVVPHGHVREHIIQFVNEEIRRQNKLEIEEEVIMPSPFMRRVAQARHEGFKEGLSKGTASGIALGLLIAAGLVGITLIMQ